MFPKVENRQLYVLDYISRFYFIPIAVWPLVFAQYISFTQVGIIFSIAFIWQTVLELPSGAMADLLGRKTTIVISQIFRNLGYVFVILSNNFWWLLLSEIADKTYNALYSGAGEALIYDSLKEQGQEQQFEDVENHAYFWATTWYITASILGGFLFVIHPKLPYIAMLVPGLIGVLVSMLYREPSIDSETFTLKNYLTQNKKGFQHIFRNKEVTLIAMYSITITFVFLTGLWWLYQKAANEVGLAPQYVGFLIGGLYGMRSIGSIVYKKFFKQLNTQSDRGLTVLAVLQGLSSLLVAVPSNIIAVAGLAGRYLTDGVRQPLVTKAQHLHIDSKYRATAISAISLVTSLILAVTYPIMGWGIDLYGARAVIGVLSLISFGIGVPLALIIQRQQYHQS